MKTTSWMDALCAPQFYILSMALALGSCGPDMASSTSGQRNAARPPILIEPPSDSPALDPTPATPPRLEVGETATWENSDSRAHTITADEDGFDSGMLEPGAKFHHVFAKAGHFKYHCTLHGETGEVWIIHARSRSSSRIDPYPTHGHGDPSLPSSCHKKGQKDCKPEPKPSHKPHCPPPSAQQIKPLGCDEDSHHDYPDNPMYPDDPMPRPTATVIPPSSLRPNPSQLSGRPGHEHPSIGLPGENGSIDEGTNFRY